MTPPPPLTALRDLDAQLASAGFAVLDAPALAADAGLDAATLARWAPLWDELPPDEYLLDGGRYRRRRHGCFVVDTAGVRAVPRRPHWQSLEYNALHGGIERWFEPLDGSDGCRPVLGAPVARAGRCTRRPCAASGPGTSRRIRFASTPPTASAARRPKARTATASTWWRCVLVSRVNIKGGETRVFDVRGPQGMRFTLDQPWSALLLDDERVIHESTPIQPLDASAPAHRDTLVLTFRRQGFQGPAA